MGDILDSDWSRQNVLRSDWLGPSVAPYTTADCRLQTADCEPGVKCRLCVKCRLQTKSKTQVGVKCRPSINCSRGRV